MEIPLLIAHSPGAGPSGSAGDYGRDLVVRSDCLFPSGASRTPELGTVWSKLNVFCPTGAELDAEQGRLGQPRFLQSDRNDWVVTHRWRTLTDPMSAPRAALPIQTSRLENGLLLTLSPDRTAPIVAVNLWYHVGSANEREGRTGFAHLFEHMLFQGSEHVAANEHFELIQRAGGTLNGSTWLDRTNYFETVPSQQLELALWLEADRMGRLLPAMTQEKLDTQRDVVKNERRWSVDNQPYGSWWEKLPALCFPPSHPFHHSLMGSMEDLSAASLEDVAAFFRTYYTPGQRGALDRRRHRRG